MEEEEEKKKKKKKGLKKDCTEVRGKNGKESGLDVTVARMQGVSCRWSGYASGLDRGG